MLKIWMCRRSDDSRYVGQPDFMFDEEIDKRVIDTDFGRRVVYECSGRAKVLTYGSLELPNGELISPKELSSGAKNIFIMNDDEEDSLCDLLWCGDNCLKFVSEISDRKDLEVCTTRFVVPKFSDIGREQGVLIMDVGVVVHSGKEFLDVVLGNELDIKNRL